MAQMWKVSLITNKECERIAKPRRGVRGVLPPGKAGEVQVAKWAPLFCMGGSLFPGGGPAPGGSVPEAPLASSTELNTF